MIARYYRGRGIGSVPVNAESAGLPGTGHFIESIMAEAPKITREEEERRKQAALNYVRQILLKVSPRPDRDTERAIDVISRLMAGYTVSPLKEVNTTEPSLQTILSFHASASSGGLIGKGVQVIDRQKDFEQASNAIRQILTVRGRQLTAAQIDYFAKTMAGISTIPDKAASQARSVEEVRQLNSELARQNRETIFPILITFFGGIATEHEITEGIGELLYTKFMSFLPNPVSFAFTGTVLGNSAGTSMLDTLHTQLLQSAKALTSPEERQRTDAERQLLAQNASFFLQEKVRDMSARAVLPAVSKEQESRGIEVLSRLLVGQTVSPMQQALREVAGKRVQVQVRDRAADYQKALEALRSTTPATAPAEAVERLAKMMAGMREGLGSLQADFEKALAVIERVYTNTMTGEEKTGLAQSVVKVISEVEAEEQAKAQEAAAKATTTTTLPATQQQNNQQQGTQEQGGDKSGKTPATPDTEKRKKYLMYGGIAVGTIAAGVGLYYLLKPSGKSLSGVRKSKKRKKK